MRRFHHSERIEVNIRLRFEQRRAHFLRSPWTSRLWIHSLIVEEFRQRMEVIADVICMLISMDLASSPLNSL